METSHVLVNAVRVQVESARNQLSANGTYRAQPADGRLLYSSSWEVNVSDSGNQVVEIYVRLLQEGTACSRPTQSLVLGNGLFKLLATENYDPEDEHWEFLPGATVRAYLLAVPPTDY